MLPFAHIGIAVFISSFLSLSMLFTAIGTILPDIIDKSLFLIGIAPTGRFIAHTIFFAPILTLPILMKRKDLAFGFLLGNYLHLLLDAQHFMPWLYPIVQYDFPTGYTPHFELSYLFLEVIGVGLLFIAVRFNSKIVEYRKKLTSKIK